MPKKILITASLLVVVLIAGLYYWPRSQRSENVEIAVNVPLTGPLATYGVDAQRGIQFALSDIPAEAPGPALRLSWSDNQADAAKAVSIMQQHYLKPIDIYISGLNPQTEAIMAQIEERGTPHFIFSFGATMTQRANNLFRCYLSFKLETPVVLDYVKNRKPSKIAIAYVNLSHTQEAYQKILKPRLVGEGINEENLLLEPYPVEQADFRNILLKIKAFEPDLLILSGFDIHMVGLVRTIRELQMQNKIDVLASYDLIDAAKILGAEEIDGLHVVTPSFLARLDEPKIANWVKGFRQMHDEDPSYSAFLCYDLCYILDDAANRVAPPFDSKAWNAAIRQTNISGITGQLSFDKDGDVMIPIEIGKYENGILKPLETAKQVVGAGK